MLIIKLKNFERNVHLLKIPKNTMKTKFILVDLRFENVIINKKVQQCGGNFGEISYFPYMRILERIN